MSKKQSDVIDLGKLMGVCLDHKRIIVLSKLLFIGFGIIYVLLAPSIYNATASLQVEQKYTGGALRELSAIYEQESSAPTEIAILKSRAILSKTVDELNLTTRAYPIYTIPFFSKGIEKLLGTKPEISITSFIPKQKDLEELILEITADNEYLLINESNQGILKGRVGEKYDNEYVSIEVSELKGDVGKRFSVKKISDLKVIEELQAALSANELGKQTGIISVSFKGEDGEYIHNVLRSITKNYIQHSIGRNSTEAEKSLIFLQKRLPEIRERLEESENALNEYRQQSASVDLGLEAKSVLDTLVQLEADLNSLTIKESEISQRFTKRHPNYVALIQQRKVLQAEKRRLTRQLEDLPETQKDIVRLTRDFEVDQQIYIQLLNKIQELDVVKAGTVANVRIIDEAQTMPEPIAPRKVIILILSAIVGGLLGCIIVFAKHFINKGIKSSSEIAEIGLLPYATIPYSRSQAKTSLGKFESQKGIKPKSTGLLSEEIADDLSIEALRGVRTNLLYRLSTTNNNVVLLSGTSQGVGKNFIASNIANLLAKSGKKVLLIDADLRRSYLHYTLNLSNQLGLSELLVQNTAFEQAVQTVSPNFSVITKGVTPNNPSELLSLPRCKQLVDWASTNYDVVIIAAPPVLTVTDASIIGQYAATTLLISRFDQTTAREIEATRQRFVYAGIDIYGVILNAVKLQAINKDDYFHRYYHA